MLRIPGFVVALLAVVSVGTAAAVLRTTSVVPSRTAAATATIKEVNREHHNLGLKRQYVKSDEIWRISCIPLTRKLYRCDWRVRVKDASTVWTGRSKVRFYRLATDVTLYQVSCDGIICSGL